MPDSGGPSPIIPVAGAAVDRVGEALDGSKTAAGPTAALDGPTAALVRLSAWIAGGTEQEVRAGLDACQAAGVPDRWVEELVLQSYLFAGFPRTLNAAREWRARRGASERRAGTANAGPIPDSRAMVSEVGKEQAAGAMAAEVGMDQAASAMAADVGRWQAAGEATCARVYGRHYEKLRHNIRALHPALDDWMIVEGYGKVLSRDGLDLGRRELCIVAACTATRQARQLHSHLHGARNVGVPDTAVAAALDALEGAAPPDALAAARLLWQRVVGKTGEPRVR
jgi:4-carboxymuconolactone decarboxylase